MRAKPSSAPAGVFHVRPPSLSFVEGGAIPRCVACAIAPHEHRQELRSEESFVAARRAARPRRSESCWSSRSPTTLRLISVSFAVFGLRDVFSAGRPSRSALPAKVRPCANVCRLEEVARRRAPDTRRVVAGGHRREQYRPTHFLPTGADGLRAVARLILRRTGFGHCQKGYAHGREATDTFIDGYSSLCECRCRRGRPRGGSDGVSAVPGLSFPAARTASDRTLARRHRRA